LDASLAGREHGLDAVGSRRAPALGTPPNRIRSLVVAVIAGLAACGCSDDDENGPPFVQLPDSRLIKVQSVGLAAFGPINPHTATASVTTEAFGEPSSVVPHGAACSTSWSALGLEIDFGATRDADPCADDAQVERLVVAGRAAAEAGWRTAEGIRPRQPVAAVRRIYPGAGMIRPGRNVLVRPPASGPDGPPVLVVTVADGRVEAMEFPIDAGSG
jgi:hypothetical protein